MVLKAFSPKSPGVSSIASVTRKLELLYVEDDDLNWEIAELHLRTGYVLTRARNAAEALMLLEGRAFDAVLMDIQLGRSDLSGFETAQAIRATRTTQNLPLYARKSPHPDVPIIFVTDNHDSYIRLQVLENGGDDLVTKPVDFTQLALSLRRCLNKGSSSKRLPSREAI